ncbi:MAG: UDP-N-acetylmuramoyl-tripeptide--D-alanyl-D-alanine ligase [Phycisphaerales bacterium JB043]
MSFWHLLNIASLLGHSVDSDEIASGLSTDTRTLEPGQIFLAIRGEHHDAHDHIEEAARKGAVCAIVERPVGCDLPALQVDSTLDALHTLARAYRHHLGARVVAITGSNGKTTTCRLTHAAMNDPKSTHAPRDSFNNHIGVPLTILSAPERARTIICELGTSSPGEIALLSRLIQPDIAAITSIGRAHIEGLGSIEGIIEEKSSIIEGLAPDGVVLIPGSLRERFGSEPRAHVVEHELVETTPESTTFHVEPLGELTIPLTGVHNASNASVAATIAHLLGTSHDAIRAGLSGAAPPPMRLARHELVDLTLINDAYNANPESTRASIESFVTICPDAARRVLVLGDMLELGAHADDAHSQIGDVVAAHDIDVLITIGEVSRHASASAIHTRPTLTAHHINTLDDDALETIITALSPGDAVLLKGSRSMRLERIEQKLRQRASAAP